jgi:serine-type D-Ala-D-Ala carboxypeptidase
LPGTDKALGFDVPAAENSSSGRYFSKASVGHLGFTGTSFWMDLDRSIIAILLTNRVHPSRKNETIRAFRPQLHDAVMQCWALDP